MFRTGPIHAHAVTVWLLSTADALGAPVDYSHLSLKQAVAQALDHSPLVIESALEVKRLQGLKAGVPGVLAENPVLTTETGAHRDLGWVGDQAAASVRLAQPLDLFGQATTRKKAAEERVSAAAARLELARAEVAARAHLLYAAVQAAASRVDLCRERMAATRQSVDALRMRVHLGASSEIDLRLAQAEGGRAEAALDDALAQLSLARLSFQSLLDLPAGTEIMPAERFEPPSWWPAEADGGAVFRHHVAVRAVERRGLAAMPFT